MVIGGAYEVKDSPGSTRSINSELSNQGFVETWGYKAQKK